MAMGTRVPFTALVLRVACKGLAQGCYTVSGETWTHVSRCHVIYHLVSAVLGGGVTMCCGLCHLLLVYCKCFAICQLEIGTHCLHVKTSLLMVTFFEVSGHCSLIEGVFVLNDILHQFCFCDVL